MSVAKVVYKPVALMAGGLGGVVAGAVVKQVWKAVAGEEKTPAATDQHRGWREVLLAAALQGAVFALMKAIVDRLGASGVRRLTGEWPD
ncbi:DUF4235 domain-containing protein [Kitasatospora sp. RB6PN24]|uniref:DUF4235 domain-containing protein n=1 Tax=Kitasatospora humi TaxID=2893891 RepID=UPI001E30DA70|nr:DUF4235 domain-containing protein [Kitasatospora humi]MCC9305916.1 DUF4235 domain-containing protein [Kitasatospora humi]